MKSKWKESQLKGIISDQEYSYCWAGKSVTEIASYKPDMSGIIPKKVFSESQLYSRLLTCIAA